MGYRLGKKPSTPTHTGAMLRGGPLCKCNGCTLLRIEARNPHEYQTKVYKDVRGSVLVPGARVAFNYSGDVAIGVIESITPGGIFHIRRETHLTQSNPLSKVKKRGSILVIKEETVAMEEADLFQELADLQNQQISLSSLFATLANAWDLDEVQVFLEEQYGDDWKERFGNTSS